MRDAYDPYYLAITAFNTGRTNIGNRLLYGCNINMQLCNTTRHVLRYLKSTVLLKGLIKM